MRVVLGDDARRVIATEAPSSADGRETGGVLLGHDHSDEVLITVAGDPGPKADRRVDGFLRHLDHARRLGDLAYDRDGSVWIGEWHTHPHGPLVPSPTDMATYSELLDDRELDFDRIVSLIVTPCLVHGWVEVVVSAWVVDRQGARAADVVAPEHSDREDRPGSSLK